MRKCSKCSFSTENDTFKFCPLCAEELIETKKKNLYMVGITKGEPVSSPIRLTYEESMLLKRVSEELAENTRDCNARIWIKF